LGATSAEMEHLRVMDQVITDEEKRLELMDKGKSMLEQYLSPLEKLTKAEDDLNQLKAIGAIDQKTYDRAMKAAHKDFVDGKKEEARLNTQAQLNYAFMNNRAVRENSDEFYKMMQQVPDATTPKLTQPGGIGGVGGGNQPNEKTQLRIATTLDKIYADNKKRDEMRIVPADLGGA
jgi:enoyl reductase-like protein